MRILYSPNDISKITLKPEWYLENNHPTDWEFSILLMVLQKITSNPEWYLENNHPAVSESSIQLMIFQT